MTKEEPVNELVHDLLQNEVARESAGISKTDKNILMDLQQVLERKGLLPFEALSLEDFEKYEVSLDRLGQVGQMFQDVSAELSDIEINIYSLGRIGLRIHDPVAFLSEFRLHDDYLAMFLLKNSLEERKQ